MVTNLESERSFAYRRALLKSVEKDDPGHSPLRITEDAVVGVTYQLDPELDRAITVQVLSPCCRRVTSARVNDNARRCEGCGGPVRVSDTVPDWCEVWLQPDYSPEEPGGLQTWVEQWLDSLGHSPLEAVILATELSKALMDFLPEAEVLLNERREAWLSGRA